MKNLNFVQLFSGGANVLFTIERTQQSAEFIDVRVWKRWWIEVLPKLFEFIFLNEFVERYDILSVTNFLNFDLKTLENQISVLVTVM